MRLLALSDIHGNAEAITALRARETNRFDVVVVAGDIGTRASSIFATLDSFDCPVLYVLGNWDRDLACGAMLGRRSQHLHLSPARVGRWTIVGLSEDCFDRRPGQRGEFDLLNGKQRAARNREALAVAIQESGADPGEVAVVTHDRLYGLQKTIPQIPLFVFGHIHEFKVSRFSDATFVRVGAMHRPITVRPARKSNFSWEDCRNLNAGNYAIVEVNESGRVTVSRVDLPVTWDGWIQVPHTTLISAPWV